ncbi:glycosyltransferase [Loktanella salsilacus]|uniref:glycosyltransferase n=2 Tax=Loktanella salsilacus TaxID=195913 RepID=UPI0030FB717E
MTSRRAFVADHMAVLPYGHNVEALRLFEAELRSRDIDVTTLVCAALPKGIEGAEDYARVLTYPYNGHVEAIRKYRDFPKVAGNKISKLRRLRDKALWMGADAAGLDGMGRRVRANWLEVIKRYGITGTDWIFMPSVDHYGLLCLMQVLQTLPADRRPSVHGRMIGVMESFSYARGAARTRLLTAVRDAQKAGVRVSLSAETPVYQDYLTSVLRQDVGYLTYPCIAPYKPIDWGRRPFQLTSPGQGRADKGYFGLAAISDALKVHFKRGQVMLSTQGMRKDDTYFSRAYEARLAAKIDLNVRAARLSSDEINAMYRHAHVLVLPYARDIYALRGSAVYQEGLAHGRLVVTYDGTGVASMVKRYGNGVCVKDDRALAEAVHQLSQRPAAWVHDVTRRARDAYEADFATSFDAVLDAAFKGRG